MADSKESTSGGVHFDKLSNSYEELTGGGTLEIARQLLTLMPPIHATSVILDNGCGPAIVTFTILSSLPGNTSPPTIHATDNSAGMISQAEARIRHYNWNTVSASIMDSSSLTFPANTFTHSYTNFVIFMVDDPAKVAAEIFRTLKPGGVAVVTTWHDHGCIPILAAAQKAVRPDLGEFKFGLPEEVFEPIWLEETMVKGGFGKNKMEVRDCHCGLRAKNLDALSENLGGMFGWLLKAWSEEDKQRWRVEIRKALDDAEQKGELAKREGDIGIKMVASVAICIK